MGNRWSTAVAHSGFSGRLPGLTTVRSKRCPSRLTAATISGTHEEDTGILAPRSRRGLDLWVLGAYLLRRSTLRLLVFQLARVPSSTGGSTPTDSESRTDRT